MPLCSRRAWKTPAGFTTWPTPGCYDDGVVLPRPNPDPQTGRRRVFIMTTIQTQRPTLVYVACFYPDLTAFAGLLLSRHSHLRRREVRRCGPWDQVTCGSFERKAATRAAC